MIKDLQQSLRKWRLNIAVAVVAAVITWYFSLLTLYGVAATGVVWLVVWLIFGGVYLLLQWSDLPKVFAKLLTRDRFLRMDVKSLFRHYHDEVPVFEVFPYTELANWSNGEGVDFPIIDLEIHSQAFAAQGWSIPIDRFRAKEQARRRQEGFESGGNRRLVRLRDAKRANSGIRLVIQPAYYSDQGATNFILDTKLPRTMEGAHTLRSYLERNNPGHLVPLEDETLANTVGSCVLLRCRVYGHRQPLFTFRSAGVAINRHTWNSTSSSAVGWPTDAQPNATFEEFFTNWTRDHLTDEVGIKHDEVTLLKPMALCREWGRGGKPQLFYVGETNLEFNEIRERMRQIQKDKDEKREVVETLPFPMMKGTPTFKNLKDLAENYKKWNLNPEAAVAYYYYLMWEIKGVNG